MSTSETLNPIRLLSKEEYWKQFYNAIQPDTIYRSTQAAEKATAFAKRDHTTVDGFGDEHDNETTTNSPLLTSNSSKGKKIKPQQSLTEEFSPRKTISASTGNTNSDIYEVRNVSSLTKAARESYMCIQDLRQIHCNLMFLSEKVELEKSKSKSSLTIKSNGGFDEMNKYLSQLSKDSFVLTHKLNEIAIGFHVVEDFLRNPQYLSNLDFSSRGRIRIPTISSANKTITQFEELELQAMSVANFLKVKYPKEKHVITLVNSFSFILKHLQRCAMHSKAVFDAVMYIYSRIGLEVFQQFVLQLNFVERSDIIMEMQTLRRRIDEITIAFEKLSWKCHLILHRSQAFPSRSTVTTPLKTKSFPPSAKIDNVNEKRASNAIPNKKVKNKKTKRKTSVVEQFISNQNEMKTTQPPPTPCDIPDNTSDHL